jgi:hypothetical protein
VFEELDALEVVLIPVNLEDVLEVLVLRLVLLIFWDADDVLTKDADLEDDMDGIGLEVELIFPVELGFDVIGFREDVLEELAFEELLPVIKDDKLLILVGDEDLEILDDDLCELTEERKSDEDEDDDDNGPLDTTELFDVLVVEAEVLVDVKNVVGDEIGRFGQFVADSFPVSVVVTWTVCVVSKIVAVSVAKYVV